MDLKQAALKAHKAVEDEKLRKWHIEQQAKVEELKNITEKKIEEAKKWALPILNHKFRDEEGYELEIDWVFKEPTNISLEAWNGEVQLRVTKPNIVEVNVRTGHVFGMDSSIKRWVSFKDMEHLGSLLAKDKELHDQDMREAYRD